MSSDFFPFAVCCSSSKPLIKKMSGAEGKGFIQEISGGGEVLFFSAREKKGTRAKNISKQGLHSKLKKTTTAEKNVLPSADDIKAEKTA